MPARPPRKPFPEYAWRWASLQPTESLNFPPVFFGILRALFPLDGQPKSSPAVQAALQLVLRDIEAPLDRTRHLSLARDRERNLFRNSGQYWQALGLMEQRQGVIALTDLGRRIASRSTSQEDFVAATVRSLTLPNPRIMRPEEVARWEAAGLEIYPLRLILEILLVMYDEAPAFGYITVGELCDIVIPLAGDSCSTADHAQALRDYRAGRLSTAKWPNCTPGANDRRMATEFLLFLANNGLCDFSREGPRNAWSVRLLAPQAELARRLLGRPPGHASITSEVSAAAADQVSRLVTRTRRLVEQLQRPNQPAFRRAVFRQHGAKCLITGEATREVLVAAHIIAASVGGPERWENGIPLRADIHILWDEGLLAIHPTGAIVTAPTIQRATSYSGLPKQISIPTGVGGNLAWRLNFL